MYLRGHASIGVSALWHGSAQPFPALAVPVPANAPIYSYIYSTHKPPPDAQPCRRAPLSDEDRSTGFSGGSARHLSASGCSGIPGDTPRTPPRCCRQPLSLRGARLGLPPSRDVPQPCPPRRLRRRAGRYFGGRKRGMVFFLTASSLSRAARGAEEPRGQGP